MPPKFSIIITSYNYENYVEEAIESVLAQTYTSWELVVVDDASKDNSWAVLQRYSHHPQVQVHRNRQSLGVAGTYNTALRLSSGDLIANLDSDDRLRPGFLERMAALAEQMQEISIFACHVQGIDADGNNLLGFDERAAWFNQPFDYNDPATWIWRNPVCHNGSVIRRTAHHFVGEMSLDHHPAPDWDLWIRLLASGFRFGVAPEVLVDSRLHARAVTGTANDRLVREYAMTSAAHLHPWLIRIGRDDLVIENLKGFLRRSEFWSGSADFAAEVLERLLSGRGMTSALFALALQEFASEQIGDTTHTHGRLIEVQRELEATRQVLDSRSARLRRIETSPVFRAAVQVRRAAERLKPRS